MSKDKNPQEESIKSKKHIPIEYRGGRLLNAIRYNSNIGGIGKAILHDIASFCDLGEEATFQEWIYRSKDNLVKCTGFNEKAINKHIKILINDGYLLERPHKNKDGRNGPKEFRITSKIFDEYLITLGADDCQEITDRGGADSYPLNDRAPDNCHPLNDRAPDNCHPLAPDNSHPLGGDNCHPNHNEFQHNEDEHNEEKKIKKESATNLESGGTPETPLFLEKDSFSIERRHEKEAKRKINEINKIGCLLIVDVPNVRKFRSKYEKHEIIKIAISKIGIDRTLENINSLYESKHYFIGKKESEIINDICNINYEKIKATQDHNNKAMEIETNYITEI